MFWKRKKQPATEWLDQPRRHHYLYAHHILRGFCNDDPVQFFSYIASDERDVFAGFVWHKVREYVDAEEKTDLDAGEFVFSCLRLAGSPTILVEMPRPRAITEALFVAIVLLAKGDSDPETPQCRYFTLELGYDLLGPDPQSHAVIGEWVEDHDSESSGKHLNYGPAQDMNPESFLMEVERLIAEPDHAAQKLLLVSNAANKD